MARTKLGRILIRWLMAAGALPAVSLGAQGTPPDSAKMARQPLFTLTDAGIAGGFVGLALALYPADKSMAQQLQHQRAAANGTLDRWATGIEVLALPGAFVLGAGSYVWGRLGKHPDMADVGWHTTEAVFVGMGLTGIIKSLAGRSRPFVTADTNPHDWKFGSGLTSDARSSFPSGHATIAFAAASAATAEVHRLWPRYSLLAGSVFYGGASLVGLARMYHDQHWASDVVIGAGIGMLAGLKTVRYTHLHADNYFDRIMLHTTITPAPGGGGMITFSAPFR